MGQYKLSRKADKDIEHLYESGIAHWGLLHAQDYLHDLIKQFESLAHAPELYRERNRFIPPVRICPCGSHVIIYRIVSDDMIEIIRVRHGREDWLP